MPDQIPTPTLSDEDFARVTAFVLDGQGGVVFEDLGRGVFQALRAKDQPAFWFGLIQIARNLRKTLPHIDPPEPPRHKLHAELVALGFEPSADPNHFTGPGDLVWSDTGWRFIGKKTLLHHGTAIEELRQVIAIENNENLSH